MKTVIGFMLVGVAFVGFGCGDDDGGGGTIRTDGGATGNDGGRTGTDGSTTGGRDSGTTAGNDAGTNPGNDAGTNPGNDAGTNPGNDAGANPGNDGGNPRPDAGPPRMVTCSGTEACSMADCTVITTENVIDLVESCGFSCGLEEDVASCADQCLTMMVSPSMLSGGCTGCFADTIECAVENCASICVTGGRAACDACLCTNDCISELETCSGVNDGRCM